MQNHPSEEGAENPPSFAFLSVCALEMVVLFHQSEREDEESTHHPLRKEEKQTNKGRR